MKLPTLLLRVKPKRLRVLDFDIECRPLAWYGGDFVTKQPTAIAWQFIDEWPEPHFGVIGDSDRMSLVLTEERIMLERFVADYNRADVVTGHFIRGFDLPTINGALMRLGMPLLADKATQDTKLDLAKAAGISKSQENLGAMLKLEHKKVEMNTAKWADANMLLPGGIEDAIARVTGDVRQHIEMRALLLQRGLLRVPRMWRSNGAARLDEYTP